MSDVQSDTQEQPPEKTLETPNVDMPNVDVKALAKEALKKRYPVNVGSCASFAYGFFFKNIVFSLRLIVPYILIFVGAQVLFGAYLEANTLNVHTVLHHGLIYSLMGWMIFGISRRVLLEERLSNLKFGDIFGGDRMAALLNAMIVFCIAGLAVDYCTQELMATMLDGGVHKGNLLLVLIYAYAISIFYMAGFLSIALGAEAKPLSYLYRCFSPLYLTKIFIIWLVCALPVLGVYYAVNFFVILGGDFDLAGQLMNRQGFGDMLAYGLTSAVSFIIFAAAFVKSTENFLLFSAKKRLKKNNHEAT